MINKIVDQLYVGDLRDALMLQVFNSENITAVLNVCEEKDNILSPIKYASIPFADGKSIPREQFESCMLWLTNQYKQGDNILIHCTLGVSRSPTICAAFMAKIGLAPTIHDAYQIVKASRNQANPSPIVYASATVLLEVE